MNKSNFGTIVLTIFTTLAVGLAVFIGFNYQASRDFVHGLFFQPTPEVAKIQEALNLTDTGNRIFKASNPSLENEENFNKRCNSYNPGVSVLGCYINNNIYVYNIQNEELDGIIESTTAHELLHAAWIRLTDSDRAMIIPFLDEVYSENLEQLGVVEDYEDGARADELFARIGTEIQNVPTELEEVYNRYFADRTNIVNYYNQYRVVFNKLSNSIKGLSDRIAELKQSIELKTASYTERSAKLATAIEEFNNCANQTGCFTSANFVNRRAELANEQSALATLYSQIIAETNEHNQKVTEYNQNALKINYYTSIINSNINQE